ncbi:MAG: DUF192 domain-containing protein [Chloroflexi bacterium]|nr:DUF192 domain-containing protein [Chloroflexota bacterium]
MSKLSRRGRYQLPRAWQLLQGITAAFLLSILTVPALPVALAAEPYPVQWVANFIPTSLWSGTDAAAIDLQDLPQFTPLVALNSAGERVLVLNPATEGLGYIDARDIGPVGPAYPSLLVIGAQGAVRLVRVELATTPKQWQTGLMNRPSLSADTGMLFVFPSDVTYSFWMKDTIIPLSVAFLDDEGTVLAIEDMQPLTTDIHVSPGPYRYALEVPQSYLSGLGVSAGAPTWLFFPQ